MVRIATACKLIQKDADRANSRSGLLENDGGELIWGATVVSKINEILGNLGKLLATLLTLALLAMVAHRVFYDRSVQIGTIVVPKDLEERGYTSRLPLRSVIPDGPILPLFPNAPRFSMIPSHSLGKWR